MDNETFYDDEIAPVLLALAKKCEERGMAFLALVEYEHGKTAETLTRPAGTGIAFLMTETAAKAQGNFDALVNAVRRHAAKHGHNSAYLSILDGDHKAV